MLTKQLRLYGLLICTLFAGQLWADTCNVKDYGALPVDTVNGQPTTVIKINGTDTRFIVDTEIPYNTMSKTTVSTLGLTLQPVPGGMHMGNGADYGAMHVIRVKELTLLGTTLNDVQFLVGGSDMGYGELGANLIDVADVEFDLAHGKMSLFSSEGCGDSPLAYWAKDNNYFVAKMEPMLNPNDQRTLFDQRTKLDVVINGTPLHALLDTNSPGTWLSSTAARRAGIDLDGPNVKVDIRHESHSAKMVKTWTVNVDSVSIGSETIHHTPMQVKEGVWGDHETDMLLGVDFLLAHRVYIANAQHKVYFTYNGGNVFAGAAPGNGGNANSGTNGDDKNAAPKSAGDYAQSGEAHLNHDEPDAALADLDQAIRLAPDQAGYYVVRARAHVTQHQPDAALADLDKALSLDPKNVDALLMRAEFRFAHKDVANAIADVTAATPLLTAGSVQAARAASIDIQLDQAAAALPLLDDWIRMHDDDPKLGTALGERCWARALVNQMLDDALADCHKAIELNGERAAYFNSIGLLEFRQGHYAESIKAYQRTIALQPRHGFAHYGLGLAETKSGQADAGKAELATASMLNPQIPARFEKFGLTPASP